MPGTQQMLSKHEMEQTGEGVGVREARKASVSGQGGEWQQTLLTGL